MISQYPHIISIASKATDATQDSNGNWIPGAAGSTTTLSCRAESASGNGYITGVDGAQINYSWIVYFPQTIPAIKTGASVTVMNGSESVCSDTVKRFSRGQLNCRVWL